MQSAPWWAEILHHLSQQTGIIAGALITILFVVMYLRHEIDGLFPWFGQAASSRAVPGGPLEPSSKNLGFLVAMVSICWGFSKVTLAVCRWIDKGNDPTYISIIYLGVAAALAGVTKIFAMKFNSQNSAVTTDAGGAADTKQ